MCRYQSLKLSVGWFNASFAGKFRSLQLCLYLDHSSVAPLPPQNAHSSQSGRVKTPYGALQASAHPPEMMLEKPDEMSLPFTSFRHCCIVGQYNLDEIRASPLSAINLAPGADYCFKPFAEMKNRWTIKGNISGQRESVAFGGVGIFPISCKPSQKIKKKNRAMTTC